MNGDDIMNEKITLEQALESIENYAINSHVTNFHNGSVVSNNSKWSGKKILAIGDSITDKNTPETKYIKFIEDAINCTVTNNGISGSGFIAGNSLVNRIGSLSNDYDLIYVFLGTNDYVGDGAPLGEWGSTNTSDFYARTGSKSGGGNLESRQRN